MAFLARAINWKLGSGDAVVRHMERALAWMVIATVFFLPISTALKNIAYVVSLALYVGVIFAAGERIFVPPPGRVLLSLLGVTILSAAVSAYPGGAIRGVWDVFRYTSFFFIVARAVRKEKHVRAVLWAAVTGFGITALIVILRDPVLGLPQFRALALGPHMAFAQFGLMGLALMFGMYVHSSLRGWPLTWLITVAGLNVMLLAIMRIRMIWAGFILVGLILGWLRSARAAITAVAVLTLMVLGVASVKSDVRDRVLSLGEIGNYKNMGEGVGRVEIWKKAIPIWREAPWLGVGPRAFFLHEAVRHDPERSKYGFDRGHVPNLWLHTAVEMGLVGVVVLAITLAYLGFWLIRWRRHFGPPWPAAVWDGAFGSWLTILVAGVTEPIFSRVYAMFFLVLLALLQTRVPVGYGSQQAASGPHSSTA